MSHTICRLFGTLVILAVVCTAHSVRAACVSSHQLLTQDSYLVSNPDWGGAGGDGSCPYAGCYDFESGPPVSPDLLEVFWALGTGDPRIGYGDDNGDWDSSSWTKHALLLGPGYVYYYPAWMTLPDGPPGIPGSAPDWSDAGDGCVLNAGATTGLDGNECMATLFGDQWSAVGYFALMTASVGALGDFAFPVSSTDSIVLRPVPEPLHLSYDPQNPFDPWSCSQIHIPAPPIPQDALHLEPACGDTIVLGYRIYGQCLQRGAMPPSDRTRDDGNPQTGWEVVAGGELPSGEPLPPDQSAVVNLDCLPFPGQDGYLALSLVFDGGFELPYVSFNAPRISCCRDDDEDGNCLYGNHLPGDCDDTNPEISWLADDYPDDGIDQDCNGADATLCFADTDRDGYGSSTTLVALDGSCDPISGEVNNSDDCDDDNAATYPGAIEVNDGVDNDCEGFGGFGATDEISGTSGFNAPADKEKFSWLTQPGAALYELARSERASFDPCLTIETTDVDFVVDPAVPAAGAAYYYLVRPISPHTGSWGLDSSGQERVMVCAAPPAEDDT